MPAHDPTASSRQSTRHDMISVDRRNALAMIGVGAATFGGLSALAHAQETSPRQQDPHSPRQNVGFDPKSGLYALPPLPYPQDALEPHIDAQTMQLHHNKHHASYVKGLNDAVAALAEIRSGKRAEEETQTWQRKLAFNGAGHFLHVIFWNSMTPQGGGSPSGALAKQFEKDFGSFGAFSNQFQAAANSVEGSGWALLAFDPISMRLMIQQVEKHQNQAIWGLVPMFAVDVWEHAYYLKYQNRRNEYTKAFLNVANWEFVARQLDGTKELLAHGRGRTE